MVTAMHGELLESLRLALTVFLYARLRDAKRLVARKTQFRDFEAAATAMSVRLLRSAAAASRLADTHLTEQVAEESDLFLRTVRDLRRIHSHLASFAYPILHRPRSRGRRAPGGGGSEPTAVGAAVTSVTGAAALPAKLFHSGSSDESSLE
jgi:phosphate:Na+ symporter